MDKQQINRVRQIIAETLGTETSEIRPESEFLADLNASPEEMRELIKKVEAEFDVELEIEDPEEELINVNNLLQLIEEAQF